MSCDAIYFVDYRFGDHERVRYVLFSLNLSIYLFIYVAPATSAVIAVIPRMQLRLFLNGPY